jgi:DNA-binding SARP family transcriptional activator/predicted ATPase
MTTTIDIQLFGIPTLKIKGRKRKLYSAKVWGLLAYLILEAEKAHSRQKLATLLWGESTDQQARHSLRQALYTLRKTLGKLADDCLFVDGDAISLQRHEGIRVDVVEFLGVSDEAISDPERLCRIADLYQGQFLEGFDLEDSAPFDEWLFFQRDALEQQAFQIHQELVDQFVTRRAYRDALPIAQKLVGLNPINESAYQRLMRIHAALGDRDAVRYQYQRCTEILHQELLAEPSAETQSLYHQLTSQERLLSNLPIPPTPFIGREKEIGELSILLDNPDIRLTTIIGTGGIGKTRLSLAVAEHLLDRFRDGVYFVPLAAINTVDSINTAIADTIHLQFFGSKDPTTQLHDFLRQKELLLILDNFEHLIDGVKFVSELLLIAPQIKILVTSREKLNLRGETIFVLGGLDFPDAPLESILEQYGAIKLFIQTAKRVNQSFQINFDDLEALLKICQIVDGMPLGIELAAAWVEVLSLNEIIAEIQRGLDFLKSSLRDMPERHHSIRAVFDSTWKRLTTEEQRALAILSVFHGDFTRTAAQQVSNASLHTLMALVGKSLLMRNDNDRFQIHELLRQYSAEKLATFADDLYQTTQTTHSAYYCHRLEEELPRLQGHFQIDALADIEADLPNVRAAWLWAVQQKNDELMRQALPSLSRFFHMRNRYHECIELLHLAIAQIEKQETELYASLAIKLGRTVASVGNHTTAIQHLEHGFALAKQLDFPDLHLEALLELSIVHYRMGNFQDVEKCVISSMEMLQNIQDSPLYPYALRMAGIVANNKGDYVTEAQYCHNALALYQQAGDLFGSAHCLNLLGVNANDRGQYADANQYYLESLAIQRELHNLRGIAACLINLGVIVYALDDFEAARHYYIESLAIRREIGDRWGVAACLGNLGIILSDIDESRRYQEESLAIFREVGSQRGVANSLTNLGDLLQREGKYDEADQYYADAMTIFQETDRAFGVAICSVGIGNLARERGDFERAWKVYCEAIAAMGKQPLPVTLLGLVGLSGVAMEQGRHIEAAQWLSLSLHHPAADSDVERFATPILARLEDKLSPDSLNAAIEHGKVLDFEMVVDTIMQDNEHVN